MPFVSNNALAVSVPENQEEIKAFGEKALQAGENQLPGMIEKMWREEVVPVWQKMWDWLLSHLGSRVKSWLKPEVEKRKSFIEEDFPGEKQEMQQEAKSGASSLWNKFKELIQ